MENVQKLERYITRLLYFNVKTKIVIDYWWYTWNGIDRFYIENAMTNLDNNWREIHILIIDHYFNSKISLQDCNQLAKTIISKLI